jgi:hypothetical protein
MSQIIDQPLVDAAIDAYVDWREACARVREAYVQWERAPSADAPVAFSSYRAALDREECAADVYGGLLTHSTVPPRYGT